MIYLSGCVPAKGLPVGMGMMVTPFMGNRIPPGIKWGADTGCFTRPADHDDDYYVRWLTRRGDPAQCLFATAPDVVGDALATLARSVPMLSRIRGAGVPAALVGQDGMTPDMVPWDEIDCLFVGGSTGWKLSQAAADLVSAARDRGKWAHMGRVNTMRRIRIARLFGCESVDGTRIAISPDTAAPLITRWMEGAKMQTTLW